jgi:hypothetical protein
VVPLLQAYYGYMAGSGAQPAADHVMEDVMYPHKPTTGRFEVKPDGFCGMTAYKLRSAYPFVRECDMW